MHNGLVRYKVKNNTVENNDINIQVLHFPNFSLRFLPQELHAIFFLLFDFNASYYTDSVYHSHDSTSHRYCL